MEIWNRSEAERIAAAQHRIEKEVIPLRITKIVQPPTGPIVIHTLREAA